MKLCTLIELSLACDLKMYGRLTADPNYHMF